VGEARSIPAGVIAWLLAGDPSTCITGVVLGILCWFGTADARRERLVDHLLVEQMPRPRSLPVRRRPT